MKNKRKVCYKQNLYAIADLEVRRCATVARSRSKKVRTTKGQSVKQDGSVAVNNGPHASRDDGVEVVTNKEPFFRSSNSGTLILNNILLSFSVTDGAALSIVIDSRKATIDTPPTLLQYN
ncbi:uncharacterized protein LOC128897090 [Hylaeus anthracinus]|uniref:uncharacterized protein LOC128897090 n=1 Tax=Hylaeus anthracinus TaxID=313031 RepID=UPI0023B92474|nr:uncharacterized protein LOC128897090 [Hylaeus anthracinus]